MWWSWPHLELHFMGKCLLKWCAVKLWVVFASVYWWCSCLVWLRFLSFYANHGAHLPFGILFPRYSTSLLSSGPSQWEKLAGDGGMEVITYFPPHCLRPHSESAPWAQLYQTRQPQCHSPMGDHPGVSKTPANVIFQSAWAWPQVSFFLETKDATLHFHGLCCQVVTSFLGWVRVCSASRYLFKWNSSWHLEFT